MKPEFTADGVAVQTFDEVYQELADGYREIYGQDINLDPDSPDGQRVGIEAKAREDAQAFALFLYNQIDPDLATGEFLNKLLKIAGVTVRPPSRSQVDVEVTTTRAVTLPAGYTVEDELGQQWETNNELALTAGVTTVTLFAADFGALEAAPDTVTEPVTIVLGVTSVTNPLAAVVGRDEETPEQVRRRRNRSLENPATSTAGGMFTAVGGLPAVTDLAIYENDQQTEDTERDLPPNSIWLIVLGGAVDEIAELMAKNKTGGTVLKGETVGTFVEELERPDGSLFIIDHVMRFDRPAFVPLLVRLSVEMKDPEAAVPEGAISAALAARGFRIAETAIASDFYRTVYSVGGTFVATALEISSDGGSTYTDGRLLPGLDGIFTIDAADVEFV